MAEDPKLQTRFRELLARKEQRENKRYSVAEIARQTDLTRAAIYPWLNGTVTGANFDTIEALCEFLECETGELLDYSPLVEGQTIGVSGTR